MIGLTSPEIISFEGDPDLAWQQLCEDPIVLQIARLATEKANHHGGFDVGGMAVATSLDGSMAVFNTGNQNLRRGPNDTKWCAEQKLLRQMERTGFDTLRMMVVCGPRQADTQSGLVAPTLNSCGECRDFMEDNIQVDVQTPIVSVHSRFFRYQINNLPELDSLHALGDRAPKDQLNQFVDPGFRNWSKNIAKHLYLPENIAETGEVNMPVTPLILPIGSTALTGEYAT